MSYCGDRGPGGWYCILRAGHTGDHQSIDNMKLWRGTPGAPVRWPGTVDRATDVGDPPRDARRMGYSGDVCRACGSLRVRANGTCLVCDSCGTTTGCS